MELNSPGVLNLQNSDIRKTSMVFLEDNIEFYPDLERSISDLSQNISILQEPNNIKQFDRNIKEPIETDCHFNITSDGLQYECNDEIDEDDIDEDEDKTEVSFEYVPDANNNKKMLGGGAFGKVYLIRNQYNKKKLAMKEIHSTPSFDDESILNEISIHSQLDHENIIKLINSSKNEETWFIVLECVPGASLADLLATDWKRCPCEENVTNWNEVEDLREKTVVFYIGQLLKAVKYLHDRQIVHCDIKPANILIDEYNAILKLCDFGHAQRLEGDSGLKKDGYGTPYYMAPEAIQITETGYGKPVDIWSIGCTVIEFLSGQPPHGNCEPEMIMYQVGRYHKLPEFPQHITDVCKNFLTSCIVIKSTNRATIDELIHHKFIFGCPGEKLKECKEPFEDSENGIHIDQADLDENEVVGVGPIVEHTVNIVRDEEELDYNPSSNVVVQKSKISKELYGEYESSWENVENARRSEDKDLGAYLKNLDVPEDEIRKFSDQECTLNGLLMHMDLNDLKDLNLKIEYRSRIWYHIRKFRGQEMSLNNAFWHGLHLCVTLYNEYMKY